MARARFEGRQTLFLPDSDYYDPRVSSGSARVGPSTIIHKISKEHGVFYYPGTRVEVPAGNGVLKSEVKVIRVRDKRRLRDYQRGIAIFEAKNEALVIVDSDGKEHIVHTGDKLHADPKKAHSIPYILYLNRVLKYEDRLKTKGLKA